MRRVDCHEPALLYKSAAISDDARLCPAKTMRNTLFSPSAEQSSNFSVHVTALIKVMLILGDIDVFCHMGSCIRQVISADKLHTSCTEQIHLSRSQNGAERTSSPICI